MSSNRKETMAALHAAHRILSESDEFEADNKAQRAALEATKAEHVEEKARLERTRQAAAAAEAEHAKWCAATQRERTRVDGEIGQLQHRLTALQTEVSERRSESDNILSGIKALTARLNLNVKS